MLGKKGRRAENLIPLITLPLVLVLCIFLWVIMGGSPRSEVEGSGGEWDLRSFDFTHESARIVGEVEYIPNALLTPADFEARSSEIQTGHVDDAIQYSTSRIRILMPEEGTYMLTRLSMDYSMKVYVNGSLMAEVGVPGDSKESTVPNTANIFLTDEPQDGVIEIVQQNSNFVHREGGAHTGWLIGLPDVVRASNGQDVANILLGCFLTLFLVHLTLYFVLRVYRANLYFALFCLVWFLRTGVTGVKVFSNLLPFMDWYVKFRIEYLSLPITGVLIVLMMRELFPGVLPKLFRLIVYLIAAVFCVIFLFADTVFMSWAMMGCYAYQIVGVLFIVVYFIRRLRRPQMAQIVSLLGTALFIYSGIRDMFYFNNVLLPPGLNIDLSKMAMLFFVFCQMTAMFIETVHMAECAKDIEQRLIAEKAVLEEVGRMKTQFLGNIAHELKTPLAVISSHAQLVLEHENRSAAPNAYTVRKMQLTVGETNRMSEMVTQLLDASRVEEGRIQLSLASIDIAALIRETVDSFYPILTKNRNTLLLDLPEDLGEVYCDAVRVRQVLFNLLANAIHFTRGGTIHVSAWQEKGYVAVAVRDNGSGIPDGRMPYVFERYYSSEPDARAESTGTGLGLFIAKHIVERHCGKITIESEEGVGTVVTFTLPIGAPSEEQDAQ